MPVVHHHVEHPDGSLAVLLDVHIDLITGDQSRVAFRRSDRSGLAAKVELDPDGAGWSVPLVPSSDIQPTGSVYRATVHIDDAPRQVWHFRVPDTGGPYEVVDLLVDPPGGPQAIIVGSALAALTAHNADPQSHPDIRALLATTGAGGAAQRLAQTRTAAVTLSGHRIVTPTPDGRVAYATNDALEHADVPLWLTLGAADADGPVQVLIAGETTESSWTWTRGPVYLGALGLLTQEPPTVDTGAVFLARIGVATAANVLHVDPQPSIVLAP